MKLSTLFPKAKKVLDYGSKVILAVPTASISTVVKNHAISLSGFATIATGAYDANHIAGFITAGILLLLFNERIAE